MGKPLKALLTASLLSLASLVSFSKAADFVEVRNLSGGGTVFGSVLNLSHLSGGQELYDVNDHSWSNSPDAGDQWVKIFTMPYGTNLDMDNHATNSETLFNGYLTVVDHLGTGVTSTNRLRFRFVAGQKDSNRVYTAKVNCYSNYTPNGQPFSWVGNFTNQQYVYLPGITGVPNGTIYGTVDVSTRFLDEPTLTSNTANAGNILNLETLVQPGVACTDVVQYTDNLVGTNGWSDVATNSWGYLNPTTNNFDGVEARTNSMGISDKKVGFYRLKRRSSVED